MINEEMRNKIMWAEEITSETHDGSYALVTAIVKAYANVPESLWDVADLDAIYLSIIGTWRVSYNVKIKRIWATCLPQKAKQELTLLVREIQKRAFRREYQNYPPEIGMFGTGFMSFNKSFPTEDSKSELRRFMRLLVDIATASNVDEETLLCRVEQEMQTSIKGIGTAIFSELLHCLLPCVFPVINGTLGVEDDGYTIIGITLDVPQDVRKYVQNVRKIKAFRDTYCMWKHYRVLDIYFIRNREVIKRLREENRK